MPESDGSKIQTAQSQFQQSPIVHDYNMEKSAKQLQEKTERYSKNLETDDEDILDEDVDKVSVWQVLKENKPEWIFILFGVFWSCIMGAVMPCFSFLFGEVMQLLGEEASIARPKSVTYAIVFLVVGVISGLAMLFQVGHYCFYLA